MLHHIFTITDITQSPHSLFYYLMFVSLMLRTHKYLLVFMNTFLAYGIHTGQVENIGASSIFVFQLFLSAGLLMFIVRSVNTQIVHRALEMI